MTMLMQSGRFGGQDIEFDAVSSGFTQSTTLTFPHIIGGQTNRLLIVNVGWEYLQPPSLPNPTPTYNGVTMVAVEGADIEIVEGTVVSRSTQFYLLDSDLPVAGSYDVIITGIGGSGWNLFGGAVSLFNVKQQARESISVSGTTQDQTIPLTSITTLTPNAWVVDALTNGTGVGTATPNAGQVERIDIQNETVGLAVSTKHVVAEGETTLGWTMQTFTSRITHALSAWAKS